MKKMILAKMMPWLAGFALLAGCVTEQVSLTPEAPPQPQAEVVPPSPNVSFAWTPGYWDWHGHWMWVHGEWGPRPHEGAVWVQGGWLRRGQGYIWVHPHWQ